MTTIVRIEHPNTGRGIFYSRNTRGEYYTDLSTILHVMVKRHNNFPTPYEDLQIKRFLEENEFCAFKSVTQMQEWITNEEIVELLLCGFNIYLLDVSEYTIGEYQVLYKKENIIQSKIINSLFTR